MVEDLPRTMSELGAALARSEEALRESLEFGRFEDGSIDPETPAEVLMRAAEPSLRVRRAILFAMGGLKLDQVFESPLQISSDERGFGLPEKGRN